MEKVYFEKRENVQYPDSKYGYAPEIKYPEYKFDDISQEKNEVYDMIRTSLYGYGLDKENFGTKNWNPLGDFIKPGQTVLIKPNWVEEKNENKKGGLDCLITHASVIRCIIDYVDIALNGNGKIVVGDSPMPDCNLEKLFINANYNAVFESCKNRGIKVNIVDLRGNKVLGFENRVIQQSMDTEEIEINLKNKSYFCEIVDKLGRFRNGIVDFEEMNSKYHNKVDNICSISKQVLEADCIINLCKPKTHRKAGFTGALKNFIGASYHKNSIPHTVVGNVSSGGDEYNGPSFIFGTETKFRDKELIALKQGKNKKGLFLKCCRVPFFCFRRITHKKFQGTGNWYKNDTIWRSILDINRAVIYGDISGNLNVIPQRKIFTLGDMIISGEKNGPLAPKPKNTGAILCSSNLVAFDFFLVGYMGLDAEQLPVLKNVNRIDSYMLPECSFDEILVLSNNDQYSNKRLREIKFDEKDYFIPAEGWEKISFRR